MLKYIGRGDFLLQVPARNLTGEEIKSLEAKYGWVNLRKTLLESGLYSEEASNKKGNLVTKSRPGKKEDK